ncbi:MAG: gamma-glutamyl-gamma-aminobutyrate hydrolase family protein [Sporomusaceae bacterium]|nr:gamma-glutamyl-gamma-aminobutyrate hydrolase family protein [Sporomusaceae bacterium]
MSKKRIVGILPNILFDREGAFPGMERVYVNSAYVRAVEAAGAVPLLLPVVADEAAIQRQLECVDGLLLSGGYDVDPLYYGEEPIPELGLTLPEMDRHQLAAARLCRDMNKPMLGICRGLQIMNVAFGGTLYQDIYKEQASGKKPASLEHVQKGQRRALSHTVDIVPNTRLAAVLGEGAVLTNSFHHQAVKDIAPGFVVNAASRDGLIEGLELPGAVFTVGVQWHPEDLCPHYENMARLFAAFVAACDSIKPGGEA